MIQQYGSPHFTKDGVTIAKALQFKNPLEEAIKQAIVQGAKETNDAAGDGTTTATALIQGLVNHGIKSATAGANPMDLKRGIDLAVAKVVEQLKTLSTNCATNESIAHVATISANNDVEVGKLIADAIKAVGPQGVVTVEEGKSDTDQLLTVEGMQFDRGYLSPYFVNNQQNMSCELDNPSC